jgi:hypothetical protein
VSDLFDLSSCRSVRVIPIGARHTETAITRRSVKRRKKSWVLFSGCTKLVGVVIVTMAFGSLASGYQLNAGFDVRLVQNFESAEKTIGLYEGLSGRPSEIAALRGSRIALSTTALLARRQLMQEFLVQNLESAKFGQSLGDDVFRMKEARANVAAIKELLTGLKRRNFGEKVVSTVEQLFPSDTRISTVIPIFYVAFGHRNIDAFVRRVVWHGNEPEFVGEGQGELTIVVNLAKAVSYGRDVDERFVGLMSVVAHEVFHAAFGVYKDNSEQWRRFYASNPTYLDQLLDLSQNEGIAYYLTLVQRSRGRLTLEGVKNVHEAFAEFNGKAEELLSRNTTPSRAQEIIQQSNTSGYWESYGAITGMIVARQIDQTFGREALIRTVADGPRAFFQKYLDVMQRNPEFPALSPTVERFIRSSR